MDRLLTAPEAAEQLGVSVRVVRDMTRSGELPAVRVGQRSIRIRPETLEQWITERETAA